MGQIIVGTRNLGVSGPIIEEKGIGHRLLCAFIDQHGDVGLIQRPRERVRTGLGIQRIVPLDIQPAFL
ncbi:hypothetical protein D3C73_655030 [compost metagenome]